MTPQIGKTTDHETFCKMGVSKKGGCLIFVTALNIPDWRPFVKIKFCI